MNKQTLIWTLIVAVPVGLAALATGYVYKDTGRLPFQSAEETASAPAAPANEAQPQTAESTEPTATQRTEEQTAAAQTETDAQSSPEPVVKGPSFDVVGVEPTGETVVAGRSDAGAIVALTANGEVVGKSIANEAGEWTIILEEPLKPGDYDVGLEVHDDKGAPIEQSEQRLAVSVPEGGNEQPLVVLNTPEGPSDILQKPDAPQQIAKVEGGTQDNVQVADAPRATGDAAGQVDQTGVASGAQTQSDDQPVSTAGTQTSREPATSNEAQVAAAPSGGAPKTQGGADTASAIANSEGAAQTAVAGSSANTAGETGASKPPAETQVAAASDEQTAPSGSVPQQKPAASVTASAEATGTPAATAQAANSRITVEAVESEKDKVYVAGTGEPGSSVRVYVGEEFQGEARVNSSGKWLVQGTKNVPEGNVEVRADLIADDGRTVDARAAVTFEKEQDQQVVLTKVIATGAGGNASSQEAAVQKALPVVIIRKGDNLWRISRRLYGDGVRYTTIYQANQDQIRDPDLIYPGQVFLTPEGDLSWPKPSEDG